MFTCRKVIVNVMDILQLVALSIDGTSASYKMNYGLAETIHHRTVQNIRLLLFSPNIDESTSNSLQRVLALLVSYYCPGRNKMAAEHFASVTVVHVNFIALYQ